MDLLLVDAHDSFTHNLSQAFAVLGARVRVVQADTIDADGIAEAAPDLVVFGPGPGHPVDAGCVVPAIRELIGRVPLLGVCLGHQALALAMGGAIVRHKPVHGKATPVHHEAADLFEGVTAGAPMGRYHSLGVDPDRVPSCLRVSAWTDDGVIMGLSHRFAPAWGVQFHPESVLSGEPGLRVLGNFLCSIRRSDHGRLSDLSA